jgi:hypothetical protein
MIVGLAFRAKSPTASGKVRDGVIAPLLAEIVTLYFPNAVPVGTTIATPFSTDLPAESVTEGNANSQEAPAGSPEH